jgi:hypothetical protein
MEEIEYELTAADLQAFKQYHQGHGPKFVKPFPPSRLQWLLKVLRSLFWSVITLSFFVVGFVYLREPSESELLFFLLHLVACLACCLLFWLATFLSTAVVAAVLRWREPVKNPLNRRLYLAVNPSGIRVKTTRSNNLYLWIDMVMVGMTNEYLFFYTDSITAHILPRRAFPDDRSFHAFVDCVDLYFEVNDGTRRWRKRLADGDQYPPRRQPHQ